MFQSHAMLTRLLALGLYSASSSATTITLDTGFESPAFNTGSIAGQDGWGIFSPSFPESISTAQAHDGTQSLYTGMPDPYNQPLGSGAIKALDAANQGEYPFSTVTFPTGYASDWWVQAWVRVESGGTGARMMLNTWGWYLSISGTGTPVLESAIPAVPPSSLANQGSSVLDQWILVRMVHDSSAPCPGNSPGQCIDFQIIGGSVNVNVSRYYTASGPMSQYLVLSGDAYWDDVMAGTGLAPVTVVPLPAAGWLLASALGTLLRSRRQA